MMEIICEISQQFLFVDYFCKIGPIVHIWPDLKYASAYVN